MVDKAVEGGYCRLRMPLKLASGFRGTVAGHRLGALEGGGCLSPFQCIPAPKPCILTSGRKPPIPCATAGDPPPPCHVPQVVMPSYWDPKRSVIIDRVRFDMSPQSKFDKKGQQVTYAQYMREKYGIKNGDLVCALGHALAPVPRGWVGTDVRGPKGAHGARPPSPARAVLKRPDFVFVKDSPKGQPPRTANRCQPPTANRQPPTANL